MESDTQPARIQPPHMQVEEALSALLKQMRPGDQLPPEPTLAREMGVSRATLREVMHAFAAQGLLVRRHGVGTFVASRLPVLETGLELLESLETMAARRGLVTEVAFLEVEERAATPTEAVGLGFAREAQVAVLIVNRVISVAGEPVADLRDIVPLTDLCREDLDADFRGSVLEVFLRRGMPRLSAARTQILAAAAEAKFAQRLHIPKNAALLKLVSQLYDCDENVVDYSVAYFLPDRFKFHVVRKVG